MTEHERSSRNPTVGASEDQKTCVFQIIHRRTPACVCRVDTADGRSPGSRIVASPCLPGRMRRQWLNRTRLPAHSCGGSCGFDRHMPGRTAFPIHPRRGTIDALVIDFSAWACQSGRRILMQSVAKVSFVLGGARSGKSRYAEGLIAALAPRWTPPWNYVATAEPGDAEMIERIAWHRARPGACAR